jgi:glycerophosphoryl diester phosphodiesterase
MKIKKHFRFVYLLLWVLLISFLTVSCSVNTTNTPELGKDDAPMVAAESKIVIIAHRGARSLAPENTLPAAVKALEHHADGWELDVAMSLDGELVVLHDDTLERTSDVEQIFPEKKSWSVYDFSMEELDQLDFGSWFIESDPFEQIAQEQISVADINAFHGVSIPTLREALEFTKSNHWWVNIEIKDATGTAADAVIVAEVVKLVEALEMEDQVLISSFKFDYLQQVKDLNPDLPTGVLVSKLVMDPLSLMQELDAQAFHPSIKTTYPNQVQLLRENGYDINVWTVNEISDMEALIDMGVTGIITDFPQRFVPLMNP